MKKKTASFVPKPLSKSPPKSAAKAVPKIIPRPATKSAQQPAPMAKLSSRLNLNSSAKQVIVAAIVVLIVFIIALISSMPRKEAMLQVQPEADKEIRSGTQVARISIKRPGETEESAETADVTTLMDHEVVDAMMPAGAEGSIPAGSRVKFKIEKFQKLATQPLKFKIFDEKGAELTPDFLQTAHEQKVHFILVSANLKEYQHLHPQYKDGQWNVSAFMPTPGTYYAYIDITPVKGKPVVLRSDLTVRAPTTGTVKYPGLTPSLLAITEGTNAVLSLNNTLSGKETTIAFKLTRSGNPVTDVKPYLGAFGHVVVLRHGDADSFTHVHPMPVTDESKGIFEFTTMFTKPGRYTVFAEFKMGSRVLLFPVTVDVT